jgi:hypothetical protein
MEEELLLLADVHKSKMMANIEQVPYELMYLKVLSSEM